jgi:nucleotide-binding universal stress UspA family protein
VTPVPHKKGREMTGTGEGLETGRIVVGVDGSEHADRALRWAVHEAEFRSATVELVYGYRISTHYAMFGTSDRDRANTAVDEIVQHNKTLLDRTKWTATTAPVLTNPAGALLEAGEDADLIVVGSRGVGGFHELFLGSTSYRVAAHASTPVAVIRGGDEPAALDRPTEIVVGIDGSRASNRALRWALDEAERHAVGVKVVHAYELLTDLALGSAMTTRQLEQFRHRAHADAIAVVDEALENVDVLGDVAVQRVIEGGSPAAVLLSQTSANDLLVVGTRGHGALGRMVFGSVSHQCLHHAIAPVIVVP